MDQSIGNLEKAARIPGKKTRKVETKFGFKADDYTLEAPPVVTSDGTLFAQGRTKIYAVKVKDDKLKLGYEKNIGSFTKTTVTGEGDIFVADHDGNVVGLDGKTGDKTWEFKVVNRPDFPGEKINFPPTQSPDGSILAVGLHRKLFSLDPKTGKKNWEREIPDLYHQPTFGTDGTVYITPTDYAMSEQSGKVLWKHNFNRNTSGLKKVFTTPQKDGTVFVSIGSEVFGIKHTVDAGEIIKKELEEAVIGKLSGEKDRPKIERNNKFVVIGGVKLPVRSFK